MGEPSIFDAEASDVTGFLIDLDGTIYDPAGLLPGAADFYAWLLSTGKQYVFLSNTGAKSAQAVQVRTARIGRG